MSHFLTSGGFYFPIGNPLNDGTWTYTWQNGRQLQKMQKSGETVEFVYNENGLRVQKTTTSTGVTKYTLHGKNIVHMTQGSNKLHFFYDAQNKPAIVVYNGVPYSYVKNLQGDIVAILDSNKNVVVSYVYDAWGRPISCSGTMANTLGKINPFRYRGYVYDEETELYYLRKRFYASCMARFLIPDEKMFGSPEPFMSHNSYLYCGNNPVKNADPDGMFLNCIIGGIVGGIYNGVKSLFIEKKPWPEVIEDAVLGALNGAISGFAVDVAVATGGWIGIAIAAAGGAAVSFIGTAYEASKNDKPLDYGTAITCALIDGGFNVLAFFLAGGAPGKPRIDFSQNIWPQLFNNMRNDGFCSAWNHTSRQVARQLHSKHYSLMATWLLKNCGTEAAITLTLSVGADIFEESIEEVAQ